MFPRTLTGLSRRRCLVGSVTHLETIVLFAIVCTGDEIFDALDGIPLSSGDEQEDGLRRMDQRRGHEKGINVP